MDDTSRGSLGRVSSVFVVFAVYAALASTSTAQEAAKQPNAPNSGQNEANNPLTPKITFNLQDYYIPSFIRGPDQDANQLLLRGLVPSDLFGAPQLFRFTLPIATAPTLPDGSETGLGDLTLMDLFMFPGKDVSFGLGPMLVAPTASSRVLGAGKWQAGAAGVAVAPQSWGLVGGLLTYQQSFAGDDDREAVKLLTVQPILFYNLPDGYYLRSSAIWNFDIENDTRYAPLGFGVGKVWQVSRTASVNAYIEPQYTVLHHGAGIPRWQVFAGLNLQFSLGQ
ncbi:hypothetical protein GAY33_27805 [Azospirillum brasilense]|uniref:hypothetical protein n=1 Tax=Azospirillum argentinense TaxID=2970906 RepID=UPI00190EA56D|nr:hypothetical protein [Azospirillum argentinense]MBK3802961.1 hypothetical protein [Azospirillum argentinense]